MGNHLENDPKTYNAAQISQKLASERGINLSQNQLRKILKSWGWRWKRTRYQKQQLPESKLKEGNFFVEVPLGVKISSTSLLRQRL